MLLELQLQIDTEEFQEMLKRTIAQQLPNFLAQGFNSFDETFERMREAAEKEAEEAAAEAAKKKDAKTPAPAPAASVEDEYDPAKEG
jgi:hypothetical protein